MAQYSGQKSLHRTHHFWTGLFQTIRPKIPPRLRILVATAHLVLRRSHPRRGQPNFWYRVGRWEYFRSGLSLQWYGPSFSSSSSAWALLTGSGSGRHIGEGWRGREPLAWGWFEKEKKRRKKWKMENGKYIPLGSERATYDTYLLYCMYIYMYVIVMLLCMYVHMLRSLCLWMGFKQRAPTQKFLSNLSYIHTCIVRIHTYITTCANLNLFWRHRPHLGQVRLTILGLSMYVHTTDQSLYVE